MFCPALGALEDIIPKKHDDVKCNSFIYNKFDMFICDMLLVYCAYTAC